jgi:3-phenylpropionate/trans-cinnamate dioxygenase ferredoxin reductase component
MDSVVILGTGQAGFQVAASLRAKHYAGAITLVGAEDALPYQRPPLSKAVMEGRAHVSQVELRPHAYFADNAIDVIGGDRAVGIDRKAKIVALNSGRALSYDRLVLATGASNRLIPSAPPVLRGLHYLRTKENAAALRHALESASNVVIVGAGFLGMEFASAAALEGRKVTVVEIGSQPMGRGVSEQVGQYFLRKHRDRGVTVDLGESVARLLEHEGRVAGVHTTSGRDIAADLVLVAVGVVPNSDLARDAGLAVSAGIVVDASLRTSDPCISAIGDCACFPINGKLVRLESVQNAVDQGRFVAEALTGASGRYEATPLFWTEQCGARLQIAGLRDGTELAVVRVQEAADKFSVFHYRAGRLVAIEAVNCPVEYMTARKLLALGVTPAPQDVENASLDLRHLLRTAHENQKVTVGANS